MAKPSKSSKSSKSERQKVIDDIKKQQKSTDQRRGYAIVGVCVLVAVLIVGAAAYSPIKEWWELRGFDDADVATIGAPADVCGDISTEPADGSAEHLPTGQQIPYEASPPMYGPHWNELNVAPAPISNKFYTAEDRPELEALVHNLEHGYNIVWYDETVAADDDQIADLRATAKALAGDTNFRLKFKAVPWTSEDGDPFPDGQHIAFTHWSAGGAGNTNAEDFEGVNQYCSEYSGEALKSFMEEYPYLDSPEPNAG